MNPQSFAHGGLSTSRRPHPSPRLGHLLGVALMQAALIVLMIHHGWHVWNHQAIGFAGDSSIYLWFLSWWGYAIAHGLSLAHTVLVSYPWGNNILWDTSVPLVLAPLSALIHLHVLSLTLAYNIASAGGWWFSGVAAYWSFARITQRPGASALGSLLTVSSAYFTNQALGHVDLMWVGFGYLLFGVVFDFVRSRHATRWLAIRVIPLMIALWLTNQEYFVTTQIMTAIGLYALVHGAFLRKVAWSEVGRVARGYLLTLAMGALILLPLVLWQLTTPVQPFRPFSYMDIYQINLANLVVPVHTLLKWGFHIHLTGNIMEQDGYLGPLFLAGLAVFGMLTVRRWRHGQGYLLFGIGVVILLAMGDFLMISAQHNSGIPLPGVVFSVVPILRDIIFDRFMWGAFWGIGLLASLMFSQLERPQWQALFAAWILLVVMTWWPSRYPVLTLHANPWISSQVAAHHIQPGDVLLVFPYDVLYNPDNNVLYTQIANHFRYRLAEGYLTPSDADLEHEGNLIAYWASLQLYGPGSSPTRAYAHVPPGPRADFVQYLRTVHPRAVVLTPMAHEMAMERWLESVLGLPSGRSGLTVYWWDPTAR